MDKFANLPGPLKWVIGVTGIGALVGAGVVAGRSSGTMLLIFLLILVGLLLLLVGGFMLWNYLQKKKQNARLSGSLKGSTTAVVPGMSATDLAKLDNLRKKFQEGIEAFRSRGKDIYSLPWYVIIGEPGSGKTEAVRHCNVGFPPGMHEGENDTGYMGAGGTINMNWWFTNHAVLLDTAGRLVFEDVKPGESSEWKEFLKLLKKNRSNCPINGLFLVIPSDSLIKDSADQIAAKAGKIAQQLDVIQRILDFRFPVYVVVTKSDKINGFREFFESVTEPQLQHQMMGWSNPLPLDSSFKPELVDAHLTQVSERLRRRRLGLMRDPIPGGTNRRIDELDSLYALPNSLSMLAPRLRRYLETIFMPGQWSAKPLFLRGIYFTSSMREGSSLDQELAETLGISADELPEGKVWERDRAYFLRDVFMEKAFKEKGLVTRASNTSSLLRKRRVFIYASCFIALAIFVGFAWFGMRTVRDTVKDRRDYWAAAARDANWPDGQWNRPVVFPGDEGGYKLFTASFPFLNSDNKVNLGEMHQKFRELADKEIKGRWTSPNLASSYNKNSKIAQRILFETSVVKPLRDAASRTIRNPTNDFARTNLADALATLLRIETAIADREKNKDKAVPVEMDSRMASSFLGSLSRFTTGADASADSNLVAVMVYTYSSNPYGRGAWPPDWFSETSKEKGVVTNNVIQTGLEYFVSTSLRDSGTNWSQVTNLQANLRSFDRAENNLFTAVKANRADDVKKAVAEIHGARAALDKTTASLAQNELFKSSMSLTNARQTYMNQVFDAFGKIERAIDEGNRRRPGYAVFTNASNRLQKEKTSFNRNLDSMSGGDPAELANLDEHFLSLMPDGKTNAISYQYRARLYERAAALSGEGNDSTTLAQLKQTVAERNDLETRFNNYGGYATNDVSRVGRYFLGGQFAQTYMRQTKKLMEPFLGFPFLQDSATTVPPQNLETAIQTFADVSQNIVGLKEDGNDEAWKAYAARVIELGKVARFLRGKDPKGSTCTITLMKDDQSNPGEARWRSSHRYVRLMSPSPGKLLKIDKTEDLMLGAVPLSQPAYFQLFYSETATDAPAATLGKKGEWGPLMLLLKAKERESLPAAEGTNKVWRIKLPFEDNPQFILPVKLTFDEAVPDIATWPKQSP
jgi:GTP-binding protein EngB required for normal cell division